jgi:hypothetical protein
MLWVALILLGLWGAFYLALRGRRRRAAFRSLNAEDQLLAEQANLMRQQARTWRTVRWIGNGFIVFILLAVLVGVLSGLHGH